MRSRWFAVALLSLAPAQAVADYYDGLRAFDGGDYVKAGEEWLAAAENNDGNAQVALGRLYLDGRGLPQNYVQAHHWLSQASQQGHPEAEELLATLTSRMTPQQLEQVRQLAGADGALSKAARAAVRSPPRTLTPAVQDELLHEWQSFIEPVFDELFTDPDDLVTSRLSVESETQPPPYLLFRVSGVGRGDSDTTRLTLEYVHGASPAQFAARYESRFSRDPDNAGAVREIDFPADRAVISGLTLDGSEALLWLDGSSFVEARRASDVMSFAQRVSTLLREADIAAFGSALAQAAVTPEDVADLTAELTALREENNALLDALADAEAERSSLEDRVNELDSLLNRLRAQTAALGATLADIEDTGSAESDQ